MNDILRRSISGLYESAFPYYYRDEEERTQFNQQNVHPVLLKHFSWKWRKIENSEQLNYGQFFEINDEEYTKVQVDPTFRQVLEGLNFEYRMIQSRAERTEGIILDLINQLDAELGIPKKGNEKEED